MKQTFVVLVLGAMATLVPTMKAAQVEPPSAFQAIEYRDAIITDATGRVVSDLGAKDFRLLVDGQAHEASNVAFLSMHSGTVRFRSPLPFLIKPDDIHLNIVFIVDDLTLSSDSVGLVRKTLQQFVDERMDSRDQVAILRTLAGSGAFEQFTSDKRLLMSAIGQIRYTHQVRAAGLEQTLRFVLEGLVNVPGRKSLVLFSESDAALSWWPQLSDLADRASVVVYAVDPRPTQAGTGPAPLAQRTGGLALHGDDVATALSRILQDQEGYYLVGYPQALAGRGFSLSVTRPGLQVRTRAGRPDLAKALQSKLPGAMATTLRSPSHTYAPEPEWEMAATGMRSPAPDWEMAMALRSPFSGSDIALSLTAVGLSTASRKLQVNATVLVDARTLATTQRQDGFRTGSLQVGTVLFGENGQPLEPVSHIAELKMTDSDYRRVIRQGLEIPLVLPVGRPGAYQVRAAVHDMTSGRVGYAHQFIQTPDLGDDQLQVSDILLTFDHAEDSDLPSATRIFPRGQALRYAYQVLNARTNAEKHVQLDRRLRLLRGREVIFDSEPYPLTPNPATDPARLPFAGLMTLNTALPPGDYLLELTVTDRVAGGRTASQLIDFTAQ